MTGELRPYYDVVIMGGGPGGSTLGALLARTSDLRVCVIEREKFPREHIGESFAHPLIPVLEESGALARVLASDCWVKKFGGIYKWDESPGTLFFDHVNFMQDGVPRWAMHVNRSEFDHILLDHAADAGAEVFQGLTVASFEPIADGCVVTLKDGRQVRARWFVDASGRQNSIATRKKRSWLSSYRNIAIWQHFLGCRPAQTLPGDWNIFREKDLSPIGCFAFLDGWVWYIPVPKILNGERRLTYSIGIVTSPAILKEPGKDYTDQPTFVRAVKQIPLLRDLIQDATPVMDRMLTATNYSMINEHFCDHDERWILIGDASYFVDPLFSSGVAFAAAQASAAALVLRTSADPNVSAELKRDLWRDYDVGWHGMAETFALSIDQWYHAIGKANPESVYWRSRGTAPDFDIREQTFAALLNTAFTPDLLYLMTRGSVRMSDLEAEGPFVKSLGEALPGEPGGDALVSAAPGVTLRESIALDVPGFKAFIPPPPFDELVPAEVKRAIARYWDDPVGQGPATPSPQARPIPCHRFVFAGRAGGAEVRTIEQYDGGLALWERLRGRPVAYRELLRDISEPQELLLRRLVRAGMVRFEGAAVATPSD